MIKKKIKTKSFLLFGVSVGIGIGVSIRVGLGLGIDVWLKSLPANK